jgi:hypothetical protein
MLEGLRQRATQLIERLMLDKDRIVKAIQHTECSEREPAEDQQSR